MKTTPLKILYLMDYFYGVGGGTERQVLELVNNIDPQQCKPHLAFFRYMPYLDAHAFPCDVRVLGIHSLGKVGTFYQLIDFSHYLRKNQIDLVHIYFNDAAMIAPIFCKLGGAKVISSRRDMGFWYSPGQLAALRISNLFVDRIVANCLAVQKNVNKLEHYPIDRVSVIYNGHEEERFLQPPVEKFRKIWNIGENDPLIGMVSSLYELKRPHDLLNSLKMIHVNHPSAQVVFVGGGELEIARVTKVAREIGVEGSVHFIGKVEDPVPIIKHFDVCVLCSETEGLSNAIIEYMGCGKATVCTNAGGNAELIRDGFNGYVVPVGDTHALANRITTLLEQSDLRGTFEANAKTTFSEVRFSTQTMVEAHLRLYLNEVQAG